MKTRSFAAAIVTGVLSVGLVSVPAADAAPTTFSSCAKLQQYYKGGVAKNSKVKNTKTVNGKKVAAKSTYKPKVSATLYKKNQRLDRDKDGIACER